MNSARFVFLALGFAAAVPFAKSDSITSGLVTQYKFDGDLNDSSGYGFHLTPGGYFTYIEDRHGIPGSAVKLTTAAPNGTFFLGQGPNLVSRSSSVSFWLRKDSEDMVGSWLFGLGHPAGIGGALGEDMHVAINYGNSIRYSFFYDAFDNATPLLGDHWYSLVFTFDYATRLRSMFIDGELIATNTAAYPFIGGTDLKMGFPGVALDDFRFYDRLLSPGEARQLASVPDETPTLSLLLLVAAGWWLVTASDRRRSRYVGARRNLVVCYTKSWHEHCVSIWPPYYRMHRLFVTAFASRSFSRASVACLLFVTSIGSSNVSAAPVLFGTNYYDLILVQDPFVGANNTWPTANAAALASVYNGYNGHLATVTSAAENEFLISLIPIGVAGNVTGAWLGGKAPEGWLSGPESEQSFLYTHWAGVEPNNRGFAYMYIGMYATGFWADDWGDFDHGAPDSRNDPVVGYFVEYEGGAAVPETTTGLPLLLSAIVLMGVHHRRTKTER